MSLRGCVALALSALCIAGCSFQNRYEREADAITRAVMNNDMRPVENDIAANVRLTRVQIAAWSDELSTVGKLESVKERPQCDPGWHCFDVKFANARYREWMRLDDHGKVVNWRFHTAPQS